jgi:ABC-2 type transport system permease protein
MTTEARATGGPELVEANAAVGFFAGLGLVLRNIAVHHHLVSNFILRDLRLKYRNSALGYLWSLLEPLLLASVYYLLFVIIAGNPEKRYALWVLIGVITWGVFARGVNGAVASLTSNASMIKQVYFPREIFAVTWVGSQLVMGALALLICVPFMIHSEVSAGLGLLMVPAGLLMAALLALGVGLLMACLNVVNRDIEHLFKFIARAGMFLSPVMWTVEMVPRSRENVIDLLMLNPMVVPITLIRNGLSGMPLGIDARHVAYSVAFCGLSFLIGAMVFKRYEAEVIKKL